MFIEVGQLDIRLSFPSVSYNKSDSKVRHIPNQSPHLLSLWKIPTISLAGS